MGFYEREIEKIDFGDLISKLETQKEKTANSPNQTIELENPFVEITKNEKFLVNLPEKDIIQTYFDYLNSRCAFLRADTYLQQINRYLKNRPEKVKTLKKNWEKQGLNYMCEKLFYDLNKYIEEMSKPMPDRNFDVGDKVKRNKWEFSPTGLSFQEYYILRDQRFPAPAIGTIIKRIHSLPEQRVKVIFNQNTNSEIKPKEIGKNDCWYVDVENLHKNIGLYFIPELEYVPINIFDICVLKNNFNGLKKILKLKS